MEQQKRRVVAAFDLASDTYDDLALKCFDLHALALVQEAHVHVGAQVLDVATGTGKVAFAAARAIGPKGRAVGIDLSEGMLAQARRRVGGLPVEFRLMDAEKLEFEDATFDVVLCGFAIWFLPDILLGMREMRRALRPGGRLAFSTRAKRSHEPMRDDASPFGALRHPSCSPSRRTVEGVQGTRASSHYPGKGRISRQTGHPTTSRLFY